MTSIGKSPRILYVSSVWPDEAAFGGELRSTNVLNALQQMGTVEVLVLDDKTRNNDFIEKGSPNRIQLRVSYQ